jgi:hypothetical protein
MYVQPFRLFSFSSAATVFEINRLSYLTDSVHSPFFLQQETSNNTTVFLSEIMRDYATASLY